MPLTPTEQTAVRAIIARDGGLEPVLSSIRDLVISDAKALATTTLQPTLSVTVSDWITPSTYVTTANPRTVLSVLADITAAWTAKDQTKLGPLFVQLYGAAKAHFGV